MVGRRESGGKEGQWREGGDSGGKETVMGRGQ